MNPGPCFTPVWQWLRLSRPRPCRRLGRSPGSAPNWLCFAETLSRSRGPSQRAACRRRLRRVASPQVVPWQCPATGADAISACIGPGRVGVVGPLGPRRIGFVSQNRFHRLVPLCRALRAAGDYGARHRHKSFAGSPLRRPPTPQVPVSAPTVSSSWDPLVRGELALFRRNAFTSRAPLQSAPCRCALCHRRGCPRGRGRAPRHSEGACPSGDRGTFQGGGP